ncbi:MAG: presqualene diphosphate synthase HpnD [Acetobacteraceae bacterium]|nr:presqualene diphosphate synthase HpnD [Acetobacteraceae bacterium]
MRVLPEDRRQAMYGVYAFCRVVDDIADGDTPYQQKLQLLAEWRARVEGLYHGVANESVTRVLLPAVQRFGLRRQDFLAVIDGMEMDAGEPIVAPDLATLDLYCERVAAAVGHLAVRAFGDSSPDADRVAHHLGRALQLTNILRDLKEDADRGRLYLPREWLTAEGVSRDPTAALQSAGLFRVCAHVAALAREHFAAAQAAMERCDSRAMKPARLMGATYAALLDRLEQRGWEHPAERVVLPTWQKLWIAARYAV